MITLIEIDGFKSFERLVLPLMPFAGVVGPNASGKSNLFDALRILSRLATASDVSQAFEGGRGLVSEQFRTLADGTSARSLRLAAECLLDPHVTDSFGTRKDLTTRRIRYEVTLRLRLDARGQVERLFVERETAVAITRQKDSWADAVLGAYPALKPFMNYGLRRAPFLSTSDDGTRIEAHQDGVQGKKRPAEHLTATYLSNITEASSFPHLFALRQTLARIRFLHLDPVAERQPADFLAPPEVLLPNASNLAAVLHRLKQESATSDNPSGRMAAIGEELARLIPGVRAVDVLQNPASRTYDLTVRMRDGQSFSSRVLSDGTLRQLALVTFVTDPARSGTLCFEEPENGVHPGRILPLVDMMRAACREPVCSPFQIIMNSHSPIVLNALEPHEIIAADMPATVQLGGQQRLTRMRTAMRQRDLFPGERISLFEIENVLKSALHDQA